MLKELHIQNLILITDQTLQFQENLHIFSGETGAGKTALFHALELMAGARFEQHMLRKGEEKAIVSARFSLPQSSKVFDLLKEASLEIDPSEELVIHRELSKDGKSKVSINCQWIPLYLLKQMAPFLLHIVSQQASQKLLDLSAHLGFLDQFASLENELTDVKKAYEDLLDLEKKMHEQKAFLLQSQTEQGLYESILEEISCAQIQDEQEEEKLYHEYEGLSTSNERLQALSQVIDLLYESEGSAFTQFSSQLPLLSKWSKHHLDLEKAHQGLIEALEQLKDPLFTLIDHRDQIEEDPKRLIYLEERLSLLNKLKKKYGPTLKDVLKKQQELQEKMEALTFKDEKLRELERALEHQKKLYDEKATFLSSKRKQAASILTRKLHSYFEKLNLNQAEFLIEIQKGSPSPLGLDRVEFFLKANVGEHPAPLHKRASGGELSRVLLALELSSSSTELAPCVLFDEVDSNLGGETAPKIGELLKQISQHKQVFCITHLPQVAVFGKHHYKIEKESLQGRTQTSVQALNQEERIEEIERMLGGKHLSEKARELASDLIKSH